MPITDTIHINPAFIKPIRAWSEFFQAASFRTPANTAEAQQRLQQNLKYYQSNYLVVLAALLAYSLLTNILFLLGFAASAISFVGLCSMPDNYSHTINGFRIELKHLQITWAVCTTIYLVYFL